MPPKRNVTESQKKTVAARQNYKCANRNYITNYDCPLWSGPRLGLFDEAGYEIDHIQEHCLTQDDSLENLQALCVSCHRVKTRRFMQRKKTERKAESKDSGSPPRSEFYYKMDIDYGDGAPGLV